MTKSIATKWGGFNPFAAQNGNALGFHTTTDEYTEPAWLKYNQTVTHPLDSSAYCLELDVSGASCEVAPLTTTAGGMDSSVSGREGARHVCLLYIPSGTTLTSRVRIYGSASIAAGGGSAIYLETDLTLSLEAPRGTAFLVNGDGGTAKTLSKGQWYAIEYAYITEDSSGTALATVQHVVRVWEGTGGGGAWTAGAAPTVTTVMNGNKNAGGAGAAYVGDTGGAHASSSATGKLYFCNFYYANENMDDLYGVPRLLWAAMDAAGTDSGWSFDYTAVDELPPNDTDSMTLVTKDAYVRESGKFPDESATITSSDLVMCFSIWTRANFGGAGKGAQALWNAYIKGGTVAFDSSSNEVSTSDSTMRTHIWAWTTSPNYAGVHLTYSDFNADGKIEVGIRGKCIGNTPIYLTAMAGCVVWNKSGETIEAMPAVVTAAGVSVAVADVPRQALGGTAPVLRPQFDHILDMRPDETGGRVRQIKDIDERLRRVTRGERELAETR